MNLLATLAIFSISCIAGGYSACDEGFCENDATCCPARYPSAWSCCEYPNGVCCEDLKHCCPEGTECDLKSRLCYPKMRLDVSNLLTSPLPKEVGEDDGPPTSILQCDKSSYCLNDATCCLKGNGKYGCCPYRHAQCCGEYCCRAGEKCGSSSLYCIREDGERVPASSQFPSI
ncbi:granulin [Trichonephila clavata]|uniref:Granulin n=1 Tax=Trichonephila clavata TaxID=2740835 RepID=A0A8X6JA86_TRICU|nr:granulin [Trichonephila clavata]